MRWFHGRAREQAERERRLAEAEFEVERLRERAEKVGGELRRRVRRNFWSETAAAIARKEV